METWLQCIHSSLKGQRENISTVHNPLHMYSCNKITQTWIQISCQNWNGFFSNISHQIMIQQAPIVSKAKRKWYKPKKVKQLALNSQLLTVQTLTNDVQVIILCLSYFITTVKIHINFWWLQWSNLYFISKLRSYGFLLVFWCTSNEMKCDPVPRGSRLKC